MTAGELRRIAQEADWFSRLGQFASTGPLVAVSAPEWRRLIIRGTADEFGDPLATPSLEIEWLPTSAHEDVGRDAATEPDLRALRLDLTRLALRSLRSRTDRELFRVGPTDMGHAAHGAALFALREAAAEAHAARPGYWASLITLFAGGQWPFGRLSGARTAVL